MIGVIGIEELGWSAAQLDAALAEVGDRLTEIYRRSAAGGISTVAVADEMVAERLG